MQELTPDSLHSFSRTLRATWPVEAVDVSGGFGLSGAGKLLEAANQRRASGEGTSSPLSGVDRDDRGSIRPT